MESRFTRQYNNAYKLWFQSRLNPIQDTDFLAPTTEEIFADLMRQPPPIQNIQIQPEPQSTQTESTTSISENPVAFAQEILHIEPDENQSKALDVQDRNIILNCSRQWGKSTAAAIKAVHHALLKPESTILVASKTLRQSGELMLKVEHFLDKAETPYSGDGINPISLVLPNRSRILAVPAEESNIRGISAVHLLIIDQAQRAGRGP